MIAPLVRKDWKLLWPLVTLVALIQAGLQWAQYQYGFFGDAQAARQLLRPLTLAWFVSICALTIATVQQDAVPATDHDWLIRPLQRRDLLIAKALFVAVTVCLPMLVLDVAYALAVGFPATTALHAGLVKELLVTAWILIPVLALATLATNMTESIILGGALVGVYAAGLGLAGWAAGPDSCPTCDTKLIWLQHQLQHVEILLGAGVLLVLQYHRRWTRRLRALALAGAFAVALVQLPWNSAFAIQTWLAPDPGAADRIAVQSAGGARVEPSGARRTASQIDLPIRVTGLTLQERLLLDRTQLEIFGAAGRPLLHAVNPGTLQWVPTVADEPVSLGQQALYIPASVREAGVQRAVRLQLEYSLTLIESLAEHRVLPQNGEWNEAGIGRCATRLDDDGTYITLSCKQLGPAPVCLSATLFGPQGRRNPEVIKCLPDYRPNLPAYTDILQFFGLDIPLRDRSGLTHYPVAFAELEESYLLVKAYRVRAHFERTLVVPDFHLARR